MEEADHLEAHATGSGEQTGHYTPSGGPRPGSSPRKRVTKRINEKKRGPGRQMTTLGGIRKQAVALKRRVKRKMNIDLGKAGIKPKKRSKEEMAMQEAPISVLFVDNTARLCWPRGSRRLSRGWVASHHTE